MTDIGFYKKSEVESLTTLSGVSLWRMMKAGEFPPSVQLSRGRVAWPRKAVHEWLARHGAADLDGGARDAA
jgi:prophage regulatory protein